MEPLSTSKKIMVWLSLYPADDSKGKWEKSAYIAFGLGSFAANVSAVAAALTFVIKYARVNLEAALYAFLHVFGFGGLVYITMIAFLSRHKTAAYFKSLFVIYHENSHGDAYDFLLKANDECEWMWKVYMKYVIGGYFISYVVMSPTSVLICYLLTGEFNAMFVYHSHIIVLPWDQETLLGYTGEIIFDMIIGHYYLIVNGCVLLLFMSLCVNHAAFFKIFENAAQNLNVSRNYRKHFETLRYLVRFHNSTKDWFLQSAEVYSLINLVQLIASMLMLSCVVFQIDLQIKHLDFNVAFLVIVAGIGITNLFLYCYYGIMATKSFENIADCTYDVNFPKLPLSLQKYFILIIGNAHIPIYYHGFGVAILNLETFSKMIRAVLTYYMMFKTITE